MSLHAGSGASVSFVAGSVLVVALQVSFGLVVHQQQVAGAPRHSKLLPPPPSWVLQRDRAADTEGAYLVRRASYSTATATEPLGIPAANPCTEPGLADKWSEVADSTKAIIHAWRTKRPQGFIERADVEARCLVEGSGDGGQPQFLTFVDRPEEALCPEVEGASAEEAQNKVRFSYPVSGDMVRLGETRDVLIIWPPSGCTVEAPCPLVLFFHSCGAGNHGIGDYNRFDARCFNDQHSIIVYPLLYSNTSFIEYWTAPENGVWDGFVMPLWETVRTEYAGLFDESRVSVAGSSMGSGMALMFAVKRPDIASVLVAAGLTDGSTCTLKDFKSEVFGQAPVSPLPAPWRLRYVALSVGELEDPLPLSHPWRINSTLDLLDVTGVTERAVVNLRLYHNLVHVQTVYSTYDRWDSLYSLLWGGDWSLLNGVGFPE